jgi:hypothetical protein
VAKRLRWDEARRRDRERDLDVPVVKPKREAKPVHPNSMAARKWGRKTWGT